jgi:hypothetical protein
MRRRFAAVARVTLAALLAFGVLMAPGNSTTAALARSPACPSPPVTIAKLVRLFEGPGGRACYGGRLLTFRAFVPRPCDGCGGTAAYALTPSWLNGLSDGEVVLSAGPAGDQMVAYVPPALGSCGTDLSTCPFRWYWGRWATVSAHFDGPVAQTCRYAEHPPGAGFTKQDAVAECREKLIVLSVGPVVALPATDAVATRDDPDRLSTVPPWMAAFALAVLLLASRSPASRRRSR